jgi:transposase
MYVDSNKTIINGKEYPRHLLRTSSRKDGKVVHRTIANISDASPEEIAAIKLALKHKKNLTELIPLKGNIKSKQGLSIGAVWLAYDIAKQLGIVAALGNSREGKLALWQVIARLIDQGSRLSAVRLAQTHAACDILHLDAFNEDDLYNNLDWLCENQAKIEDRLFRKLHSERPPQLFLYDVTSSYLEGTQNELAMFGYNRDGKKGKRQIVIGLLCNEAGQALSIEVFKGNTADQSTVKPQLDKLSQRFGNAEITFVGDRGMLKSPQIKNLLEHNYHYITAITKPQIKTLLSEGVIQMSLFDENLSEVIDDDGTRYILRCNPLRAKEMQASWEKKLNSIYKLSAQQNSYLSQHSRASSELALRKVQMLCEKYKLDKFVTVSMSDGFIIVSEDNAAISEVTKLDGCYVLKTDLKPEVASKELIHSRYKDLSLVETAFRTSKTVDLELRPINVRLESRTRGHVFVVMLAYRIIQELSKRWQDINIKVGEGIDELKALCAVEITIGDDININQIPEPRGLTKTLLTAANVELTEAISARNVNVATRKNLAKRR